MNLKVSIIIPTYKRPKLLVRCIHALIQQNFNKEDYEIIVVSDGVDFATQQTVESCSDSDFPGIRYLVSKKSGPARARNRGWHEAEGEIVAFTDDDTIPDKNWLKHGVELFQDQTTDAVAGKIVVPIPNHPTDYEKNTAYLTDTEFVTANCFIRKSVLEEIGGFDEQFKTAWREDSDLQFRLIEHNKKIIKENTAIVVHPVRHAPWGVSLKEQMKSMYNALLYKKHPRLYRKKIQSSPPWQYYAIVGSFFITIAAYFAKLNIITTIGIIFWLMLTFYFFSKRIAHTSHTSQHIAEMFFTSLIIPFLSVYWRIYGAIKYKVLFF